MLRVFSLFCADLDNSFSVRDMTENERGTVGIASGLPVYIVAFKQWCSETLGAWMGKSRG